MAYKIVISMVTDKTARQMSRYLMEHNYHHAIIPVKGYYKVEFYPPTDMDKVAKALEIMWFATACKISRNLIKTESHVTQTDIDGLVAFGKARCAEVQGLEAEIATLRYNAGLPSEVVESGGDAS